MTMRQQQIDELLESSSTPSQSVNKNQELSKNNNRNSAKQIKKAVNQKQAGIEKQLLSGMEDMEDQYGEQFEQVASNGEQTANIQQFQQVISDGEQAANIEQKQINDDFEEEQIRSEQKSIPSLKRVSQIQSQYDSQVNDEVIDEIAQDQKSGEWFKKDDEMSMAQSQFIESSNMGAQKQQKVKTTLNKNTFQLEDKAKKQSNNKQSIKDKKPIKTASINNKIIKPAIQKIVSGKVANKRTAQQVEQKMKEITEEKNKLQNLKKQKQAKIDIQKRKQYQQALLKQNERKQKNRKILEEQKNKKKPDKISSKSELGSVKNLDQQAQNAIIEKNKAKNSNIITQQLKNQKKREEKQIKIDIEQKNKKKLKELEPQKIVNKVNGEQKKDKFWKQVHDVKQAKVKEKVKEQAEVDTVLIKQLKTQIREQEKQNKIKRTKIHEFEKQIETLKAKFKNKEKVFYKQSHTAEENKTKTQIHVNFSELSPVQKFVSYFPEAANPEQIFNIIDDNKDGMLTTPEIQAKILQLGVDPGIVNQLHKVLDQNSDGNVTLEQFSFIIDQQIKKQRDYRQIMQGIQIINPIQIQAHIIDMRAKISYMDKQIQKQYGNVANQYEQKYKVYLQKLKKLQTRLKSEKNAKANSGSTQLQINSAFLLAQQAQKLSGQRKMLQNIIQQMEKNVYKNVGDKNKSLLGKVQQNMRLKQKIYRLKNQIQEIQLRYISMRKIKENKRGYMQRQTKNKNEMQDVYRRTKQYQLKISDPTKEIRNNTFLNQIKFLSAVIMIQRNYRKKKAQKQAAALKNK